jgi:hypothetical protein
MKFCLILVVIEEEWSNFVREGVEGKKTRRVDVYFCSRVSTSFLNVYNSTRKIYKRSMDNY